MLSLRTPARHAASDKQQKTEGTSSGSQWLPSLSREDVANSTCHSLLKSTPVCVGGEGRERRVVSKHTYFLLRHCDDRPAQKKRVSHNNFDPYLPFDISQWTLWMELF